MADDILVTMNGVPIITRRDFEREKEIIFNLNPQLKKALPVMDPQEVDRCFLELVVRQKIIKEYIKIHKLDKSAVYEAELKIYKDDENQVNAKIFYDQFVVAVDDAEVRHFYEENKEKYFQYTSYESVKEKIREMLENEKRRELADQEIDKLKEMYKVEVNKDFL